MNVQQMRYAIANCNKYRNSPTWRARVNRMPDDQIIAIYYRFVRAKII